MKGNRMQHALALGFALALAWFSQAVAQADGVAAVSSDARVLLRWYLPDNVFPPNGFVVVRRAENGASRSRRVASPLSESEAVGDGLVTQQGYAYLRAVFSPGFDGGDTGGEPLNQDDIALVRAVASLAAIANPDYARVLGVLIEDADVRPGATYGYEVYLATPAGLGRRLGGVQVTVGQTPSLPPLTGLRAVPDGDALNLFWDRPAEATLIAGYNVYRVGADGGETKLNQDLLFIPPEPGPDDPPIDFFYRDEGLEPGRSYSYRVEGVDLFGRVSPRSEPLTALLPDLRPLPTLIFSESEVLDNAIRLSWTPPQDPRVAAVGILRKTDPAGEAALITPGLLSPDATTFVDTGVRGGVTYYYALITADAGGGRYGPGALWAEKGANFDPPSSPTDLQLEPTETSLVLSWKAPPEDDVMGYRVFAGRDPAAPLEALTFVGETAELRFEQPVPANTLFDLSFRVRAVNTTGVEGPASPPVTGRVIDATPPSPPLLSDATPKDGAIELAWAQSLDPDLAHYRLLRAREGEAAYELVAPNLPAEATGFEDDAVVPGVVYRYSLEAVDASGNVSERAAPLSAAAFDLTPPEAVSGLEATLEDGGVRLRWRPPSQEPGLAYVVERAQAGADAFIQISDPLVELGFLDARGRAGQRYRVFAVDAAGNVGPPSEAVEPRRAEP